MAEAGGMQLLGLSVTGPRSGAEDVILASAMDLSQFSFFQRGTCVRPLRSAAARHRQWHAAALPHCRPASPVPARAAPLRRSLNRSGPVRAGWWTS